MKVFKSNKGFTLIEILVVISIIALLFILLLPQIESGVVRARETGVKTDFRSFQSSSELLLRESLGKDLTLDRLNAYLDYSHKVSLDGTELHTLSTDPWGNTYKVEIKDRKIVFYSHGKEENTSVKKYIFSSYYHNGVVFSCTSGFAHNNIKMNNPNIACGDDLGETVGVTPIDPSMDETITLPTEMNGSCYVIRTIGQLQAMKLDLNGCYELGNDIDASSTATWNSGKGFEPIGTRTSSEFFPFDGSFNGNDYKINQLYINQENIDYIGFFGHTNSATINNVHIVDSSVRGKGSVGILVGTASNSYLNNIHVTGELNGPSQPSSSGRGGIAGEISSSTIENSSFIGIVYGQRNTGGLVGDNRGTIKNSFSEGEIRGLYYGSDSLGGLVGMNYNGTIENSYSTSQVNGHRYLGSLVGNDDYGSNSITNTYGTGQINGTSDVGGLLGKKYLFTTISNSYYDQNTTGLSTSKGGTGKTTVEMKNQTTYTSWDFTTIWAINPSINNGYPYLRNNPPN